MGVVVDFPAAATLRAEALADAHIPAQDAAEHYYLCWLSFENALADGDLPEAAEQIASLLAYALGPDAPPATLSLRDMMAHGLAERLCEALRIRRAETSND